LGKETVITIHGVNPDRQWQERVGRVLAPHFDCKTFTYYGYDTVLGAVRAVANITIFVLALAVVFAAFYEAFTGNWMVAILFFAAGILCLILSVFIARLRRERYTNSIKQQVGAATTYGRPHVVAHSLGTYLIGSVLRKFPDIHLGNVVLVSSVLPRAYPWRSLLTTRPYCVLKVRNEFGTADCVTKLVGKLQWLVRDLGPSGAVGFDDDPTVVHTSPSPEADCVLCRGVPVKLHNVPLKEYAHSTVFLGDLHARKLWLPFLWGFSPDEFLRYLAICQAAAHSQRERRYNEVDEAVDELWKSVFTWTKGKRLVAYVKDVISARLKRPPKPKTPASVDELAEETMTVLHVITDAACSEAAKQDSRDENVVRFLDPRNAIVWAVEYVIRAA
jgi:pimeloyl-ACP methyl ester carboxylesterase